MAKCALCGKTGLFLKVDSDGYCKECADWKRKKLQKEELERQKRQSELAKINAIPQYKIVKSNEPKSRNRVYPEPSFSNITPKGKFLDFVVFDTETTGLAPARDRIVELGAVKFIGGLPVEVFHTFIDPEREIPKEATAINGIKAEDVASAPTIGSVIESFDSFVGDNLLIAHNLEFDLKFIYYSGSSILSGKNKFIDTLEQAKKLLKSPKVKYDKELETYAKDYDSDYDVTDYQLDTLCSYYKITIANQHSALSDAYATGKLFLRLVLEKQGTIPTEVYNSIQG